MEGTKELFAEYMGRKYPEMDLDQLTSDIESQLFPFVRQCYGDFYKSPYLLTYDLLMQASGNLNPFVQRDAFLRSLAQHLCDFQQHLMQIDDNLIPQSDGPVEVSVSEGEDLVGKKSRTDSIRTPKPFTGEYEEGRAHTAEVTRYERNPKARKRCIEIYGCKCYICGFDFADKYGEEGEGFIEVHHLVRVADKGGTYKPDPEIDLRPLCSNCHSMVHHAHWDKDMVEQMRKKYYKNPQTD